MSRKLPVWEGRVKLLVCSVETLDNFQTLTFIFYSIYQHFFDKKISTKKFQEHRKFMPNGPCHIFVAVYWDKKTKNGVPKSCSYILREIITNC